MRGYYEFLKQTQRLKILLQIYVIRKTFTNHLFTYLHLTNWPGGMEVVVRSEQSSHFLL